MAPAHTKLQLLSMLSFLLLVMLLSRGSIGFVCPLRLCPCFSWCVHLPLPFSEGLFPAPPQGLASCQSQGLPVLAAGMDCASWWSETYPESQTESEAKFIFYLELKAVRIQPQICLGSQSWETPVKEPEKLWSHSLGAKQRKNIPESSSPLILPGPLIMNALLTCSFQKPATEKLPREYVIPSFTPSFIYYSSAVYHLLDLQGNWTSCSQYLWETDQLCFRGSLQF